MIISRYGVSLIRIKPEHLELIRYWRNHQKIRRVMEFTDFITESMQIEWYRNLNPATDFYFIIEHQGVFVGLIHANKIDWHIKKTHSGLFIWDDNFLGSPVPVMASLNLLDTFFYAFDINEIEAKVKHDNVAALTYNKFLGFKEIGVSANKNFIIIRLLRDDYRQLEQNIKQHIAQADEAIVLKQFSKTRNLLSKQHVTVKFDAKKFLLE